MKKITVIALLLAAALGAQARNGSGKPAYKDAGRPSKSASATCCRG